MFLALKSISSTSHWLIYALCSYIQSHWHLLEQSMQATWSTTLGICWCSGQNLTLIKMMTRVQATKSHPKKFTTLRAQSGASTTPGLPEAPLRPEDILSLEPLPPFWDLHHSEVFLIPKVPTRTWSSNNRSSMIFVNTYAMPSSPTFIICNTSINEGSHR